MDSIAAERRAMGEQRVASIAVFAKPYRYGRTGTTGTSRTQTVPWSN
jgi:hypothetical protein